jgi:hypothetical protein
VNGVDTLRSPLYTVYASPGVTAASTACTRGKGFSGHSALYLTQFVPSRYNGNMPTRSSKRPRDVNQLAKAIVDEATGSAPPEPKPEREKNPAAVALGKLGGQKGGKARAEKLSARKRSAIAKKAAEARWRPRPEAK